MYYVGVDIGGTNVKAGIIDETGKIVVKSSIPTDSDKDYKKITGDVAAQIRALADSAKIDWQEVAGVGIGCPGIITSETGVIDYTCNLGWRGVPLAAEFTARLDKPAFVSNDANVAALGEAMFGTGKDYRDVIFITLGTGVGGGVIIDNKLFEGYLSKGAELGHMVINVDGELCGCGRRGCMEAYCSATALIRDTKRAMQADKESAMWQYVGGDPEKVDGKTAFSCSKKGDGKTRNRRLHKISPRRFVEFCKYLPSAGDNSRRRSVRPGRLSCKARSEICGRAHLRRRPCSAYAYSHRHAGQRRGTCGSGVAGHEQIKGVKKAH